MARRSPRRSKWTLRLIAVAYVGVLVLLPLAVMLYRTFEHGLAAFLSSITAPTAVHALRLSLEVAVSAVVLNTVFGVGIALLLTRYSFPGRRALSALIDLPVSVSPVIVGLALILVYGSSGWFGTTLATIGVQVIYATPGMVLATCFVSLPLVVREVVPVLDEIGLDQEQAARSLGAGPWQRFWRITLPSIRWALAYGVVLSLARALGEYGAVRVVSGNISGHTQTLPLLASERFQNFDESGAYAVAFVLVAIAVACIVVVALLRPRQDGPEQGNGRTQNGPTDDGATGRGFGDNE
jgi:sulfate transport system permease protein